MGFDEYHHYMTGYMKQKKSQERFAAYLTALQINYMIDLWTINKGNDNHHITVENIMGEEPIEIKNVSSIDKIIKNNEELERVFNSPSIGNTALDKEINRGH